MKARHGTPAPRAGLARTPVALCTALALVAGCGDGGDDDPEPTGTDIAREEPTGVVTAPGGGEQAPADPTVPGVPAAGDDPDGLEIVTPAGTPDGVGTPWLVYADLFGNRSFPDFAEARVELYDYADDKPFSDHVAFYTDTIGELDDCVTRDLATDDGVGAGGGGGEDDNELQVSGGQTLLVSTSAGTFGEIPLVDDPGNVYYDADRGLPSPVPAGATLSIPGDVFPTVDAYPIPDVRAPERLSPAVGEPLTSTSEYRWVPGTGNTSVRLEFRAIDAGTGDFLGFPVTCFASDDGEFELTDEAIEALVNAPGDIDVRYSRVNARIELRDDIAFFTYNELAE